MKHCSARVLTTLALCLLASCDQSSPAPAPSVPAPSAPQAPSTPASTTGSSGASSASTPQTPSNAPAASTLEVMGLVFPLPDGWRSVPPSNSMRLAEIQLADPAGDPSKACVVAFSSAGGTVDSNIARWAGQVVAPDGKPATATPRISTVSGLKVSTVEFTGTYAGMGDSAPRTNWMLRGSIVETSQGLLFIKMTGPAEPMTAAGAGYESMISGMTKR